MNAFELLKADHRKVAELFDRLEGASGKEKLPIFKEINSELELHTHIEEKIFYPALEKPRKTHDLTLEAYEEHNVVKTLLSELAGARSADDEWQAKAKVLRENVEHHVDEEEDELFSNAEDVLSEDEIEALGDKMEAEKARKLGVPKRAVKAAAKKQQGIVSRIKEFVGLGAEPPREKAARAKAGAKKKSASKSTKKSSPKAKAKKAAKGSKKTPKTTKASGATKSRTKRARAK